jgi:hypothetical protein
VTAGSIRTRIRAAWYFHDWPGKFEANPRPTANEGAAVIHGKEDERRANQTTNKEARHRRLKPESRRKIDL